LIREKLQLLELEAKDTITVGDPRLLVKDAANWLAYYHSMNAGPFSFLINTTSLINYLTGNMNVINLNFYLSYNSIGNVDFVVIGTDNQLKHVYTDLANPVLYSNFYESPFCGVKYDALDPQFPKVNRFKFTSPNDNSAIDANTALNNITDYEIPNLQNPKVNTFSFLIDATYLRSFLTTPNLQSPSQGGNVPYLQIYFAYKNNNINSLTLILVGVDNAGNAEFKRQMQHYVNLII